MIRDLLAEGATTGDIRNDVGPDELTSYYLQALTAARRLLSKAPVRRLLDLTLAGWKIPLSRGLPSWNLLVPAHVLPP